MNHLTSLTVNTMIIIKKDLMIIYLIVINIDHPTSINVKENDNYTLKH